jgi:small subunit ribosomal protein S7e
MLPRDRPTGGTLRSVQESLLNDVVHPTTIIGKHTHYDLRGKQVTTVFLYPHDKTTVVDRLRGFALAYSKLTGLKTAFQVAVA